MTIQYDNFLDLFSEDDSPYQKFDELKRLAPIISAWAKGEAVNSDDLDSLFQLVFSARLFNGREKAMQKHIEESKDEQVVNEIISRVMQPHQEILNAQPLALMPKSEHWKKDEH